VSDFHRLSDAQRKSLETATRNYETTMPGSVVEEYLESRGIVSRDVVGFRLGAVIEPERGHEHVRGRLAIPYLSPTGVVDLRFRAVGEQEPKYLGVGGSTTRLFNVQALHDSGQSQIAICEGEVDTLVLSGLCNIPAVGIAGVGNWKKYFRHLFIDYDDVLIIMDDDEAGHRAGEKLRRELRNGRVATLRGGDVNEFYQAHGAEAVRKELGIDD
jgi:DNA primase